jgi:acyl-ACP thioesterase
MYYFDSRVRYSEVDSEQLMTLPAMLDYLQNCCTFQSEDLGIGVDYLKSVHGAWVLSSWQIEISREPHFGERIRTGTWPYKVEGFFGYRNFVIEDESGEAIVKANSLWVYMDTARMRPARVDAHVTEVYAKEQAAELPGDWDDRRIAVPAKDSDVWHREERIQVARHHIDTNHHMNNSKYVQVAEEFLPENVRVKRLRVEYKKAAMLGDYIYPLSTDIDENKKADVLLLNEEGREYAIIQFNCI